MIDIIDVTESNKEEESKAKPKSKRAKLANTKEYREAKPLERALIAAPLASEQRLPRGYAVDLSKALKLRLQGNTDEEIGKILGVAHSVVSTSLAPFSFVQTERDEVNAFTDNELEILDYIRSLTATALIEQLSDEERRKKIDILRLNNLYGTLFDKMRLIRGQSTQNIAALSKLVLDAHAKRGTQSTDNEEE